MHKEDAWKHFVSSSSIGKGVNKDFTLHFPFWWFGIYPTICMFLSLLECEIMIFHALCQSGSVRSDLPRLPVMSSNELII